MVDEIEVFRRFIRRRGMRYTPERETIILEIFSRHDHFDVDELYLRLHRQGVRVSKASIYRTLPLLIEAGLITEVFFEDGHMHYEHTFGHEQHCHLRCTECRRVIEFFDASLEKLEDRLVRDYDFQISGYSLEVFGLCPQCREQRRAATE
ncbi:MAG: transcriptional repressor [Proteobacteria bacterium]|nr:transcriptional repressor [Pseudomonadota bacterium]MBU1739968.1 transcriptional repressor [Pseudomonadota bacterium]